VREPLLKDQSASGTSLVESVAQHIQALIVDGGLSPGDRLPSEGALALRLGVSKPVVREALSQLAGIGMIESRKGRVATVKHPSSKPLETYFRLAVGHDMEGFREAVQLRRVLEEHVAGVAAKRVTNREIQVLRSCLGELYVTRDLEQEWADADLAFHTQIFQIAKNGLMGSVLGALDEAVGRTVGKTVRGVRAVHHPEDPMASFLRHEAVFKAIEARDPAAAREAMRIHFDAVEAALDALERSLQAEPQAVK
jgi:GntR family transcriptional repressor for pyruvate dehydrogenase complex